MRDLAIGRALRCGAWQDAQQAPSRRSGRRARPRRHAFGDQYRATDLLIKAPGKLELVFTPAGGGAPERHEVHQFDGAGVALGMCARARRRSRARTSRAPPVSAEMHRGRLRAACVWWIHQAVMQRWQRVHISSLMSPCSSVKRDTMRRLMRAPHAAKAQNPAAAQVQHRGVHPRLCQVVLRVRADQAVVRAAALRQASQAAVCGGSCLGSCGRVNLWFRLLNHC